MTRGTGDQVMSEPTNPKIEFPCDYPLKIIGFAAVDFREFVIEVVRLHAADLDVSRVEVIDSRNGRFQSVRLSILATGEPQLQAIFQDLKASGRVQMVL
jgi:uncharacterized protein